MKILLKSRRTQLVILMALLRVSLRPDLSITRALHFSIIFQVRAVIVKKVVPAVLAAESGVGKKRRRTWRRLARVASMEAIGADTEAVVAEEGTAVAEVVVGDTVVVAEAAREGEVHRSPLACQLKVAFRHGQGDGHFASASGDMSSLIRDLISLDLPASYELSVHEFFLLLYHRLLEPRRGRLNSVPKCDKLQGGLMCV